MSYLDKFYNEVGAVKEFQKAVAATKFTAILEDEVYQALDKLLVSELDGDLVMERASSEIGKYVADNLHSEVSFLINAFDDYSNVTTRGILAIDPVNFREDALYFMKDHRIPKEYFKDINISDEIWVKAIESLMSDNTDGNAEFEADFDFNFNDEDGDDFEEDGEGDCEFDDEEEIEIDF